jgi:hypothetical protein
VKLPKLQFRSERGIQKGVYELSDERKWLNFHLHVIRQSRPRYHFFRIYMPGRQEPRFYEAFCVWGWVRPQLPITRFDDDRAEQGGDGATVDE